MGDAAERSSTRATPLPTAGDGLAAHGHDPDAGGHFGRYGGRFMPEALIAAVDEVAAEYEKGKALAVAGVYEIDDVIDPADTRRWITSSFPPHPVGPPPEKTRPNIDTW